MAQADVRPPFPPSVHLHQALDFEQREAYRALEDALDQPQPVHFVQPQHAPYAPPPTDKPAPSSPTNADDKDAAPPSAFAQYTSLVGRTIASPSGAHYRLAFRRVLGVGAYGVVYLAEEIEREERRYGWFSPSSPNRHERQETISTAGRMYAVKVMRCAPPGSRQRAFQAREVALHRRADGHPGVVPLHAVYGTGQPPKPRTGSTRKRKTWNSQTLIAKPEDELVWDRDAELSGAPLPVLETGVREELVYMVLSYVGGGDLFTLIAEQQLYIGRDELVTSVFVQLIDAVAWCHERGVRHRDLKPENVLCEEGGKAVYVSDFGLATTERWSRDFGCGSSYYMSPECYGDPLTPATSPNYDTLANDVWTLGVVLVNLSTGRNPWEAASPLDATFTSFCADPANFLPTILPISNEANEVLVRVFERDQAKRCSLAELKEMVTRVKRWTLRGKELDGACDGARDVAAGCGLLDLEVGEEVEMVRPGTGSSSGSSDMAERSRFSEDTVLEVDETDEADEEGGQWYDVGAGHAMDRTESACSHVSSSSEMSRSRPVSRILSHSPTLVAPRAGDSWDALDMGSGSSVGASASPRPESVPRWPKIVQGWYDSRLGLASNQDEMMQQEGQGGAPHTPPSGSGPIFGVGVVGDDATPRAGVLGTPRAESLGRAEGMRTPKGVATPRSGVPLPRALYSGVLGSTHSELADPVSPPSVLPNTSNLGSLSSPFQSRIPRYTGSPRARTESVGNELGRRVGLDVGRTGRMRMKSAPLEVSEAGVGGMLSRVRVEDVLQARAKTIRPQGSVGDLRTKVSFGDLPAKVSFGHLRSGSSMRELHSKTSISTFSVASSESGGFPITPMKGDAVLSSPRVIVSHPSDGKLWEMPRTSQGSLWDSSSSLRTTLYSGDVYPEGRRRVDSHPEGRRAMELEPGAPLFDGSARLFSSGRVGGSTLSLSGVSASPRQPRQRYRTANELGAEPTPVPVYARRRTGSGSPLKCRVKRVPVPPIPSELLEEHERQISLKRSGAGAGAEPTRGMFELVGDGDNEAGPPPGLMMYDDREGRAGRKRLLDNARAWFRRI